MSLLDSGSLSVHRLLRRPTRIELFRVLDAGVHAGVVRETIRARDVGVYVHVPYCRSTCMFCPYFRKVLRDWGELNMYLNALLKEAEFYGKLLEDLNLEVVEVHVGGGTPSLVPPHFYKRFVEKLSEFFNVRCGVGVEANPEDFKNLKVVEDFYASGVDEVSVGVQSFDEKVLKSVGRRHKPEDCVAAVENSVRAGFKWVNVDLMFLTPTIKDYVELGLEEKVGAFRRDLGKSIELGAHQVTYYATIIPKNSPGHRLAELGKLIQEVDAVDRFVEEALEFAEGSKLYLTRVYSISRKPYEYATVNLEMVGPLIGLGAGAWSNTGYYQYINVHDVANYIKLLYNGRTPAIYARRLGEGSMVWRLLFDQLSTGVVREAVFESMGLRTPFRVRALLKLMELSGLVEKVAGGYKLTKRGVLEVYKSVINYVADVPVKTTGTLSKQADVSELPLKIAI
jgi:oxygen-independent coproporphyrinogen-3 oxidase